MKTSLIILAVTLLSVPTLRAQIVADGATNTLSNVTNSFTGDVTVGTNGSFTLLLISSNALLTNSANGVIGRNATAKSNEVRLISASSRWLMGNNLYVGSNGSFNRLVVSNGATVRDNSGFLGLNVSASNNVALVTGAGSVWTNASGITLGFSGAGNQLIVSNGGVVRNGSSTVGINNSSSNNLAVVTGSGSLWSNASTLQFGFNGAGNQFVISNGGVLRSSVGSVGNGASSSNNLALVTGSNSLWTNTTDLFVGHSGVGNRLVVSDGGAMRNGHGYVGGSILGSNNLALVTGLGSVWSNSLDLEVGAFSANNRMIVSNGATVFAAGHGLIGSTANGNANSVTVTDPGSRWLAVSTIYVGSNGALSRLTITNGGFVAGANGAIGQTSSSLSNEVVVAGVGSVWTNRFDLIVGVNGPFNRLAVSDGGAVTARGSGILGLQSGANNNLAVVTGPGSRWETDFDLEVGRSGALNHLTISNGGFVTNGFDVLIGANGGADENTATLSGSGSRWLVNRLFELGYSGDDNELLIENGASLVSGKATIGVLSGSRGNDASVRGPGTTWTNLSSLEVGAAGTENTLAVFDGACVVSGNVTIGALASASGNAAGMFDPESRWLMEGDLCVGSNGPSSVLFLNGGGTVVNANGIIGFGSTSSSNRALVLGAGAVWSNRESLYVGRSGRGNQLVVGSGAMVWTPYTSMGFEASSSNNSALVIGAGSLWTNVGELFIGDSGPGNQVVVSNGGFVRNDYVAIGFNDSSSNNSVLVIDGGSLCSSATALDVGRNGSHNQLVVSNGATVTAGASVILGVLGSSLNNRVVVDGGTLHVSNALGNAVLDIRRGTNVLNAGLIDVQQLRLTNALGFFEFNGGTLITRGAAISNGLELVVGGPGGVPATWDVRAGAGDHVLSGDVMVGQLTSSFNQLLVTNGALLTNKDGFVGLSSKSNSAVVAGMGSRWVLGGSLEVGSSGSFNSLVISNGGSVAAGAVSVIGESPGGSNNLVLVTGAGSVWSNRDILRIGFFGSGSRLLITDGGTVLASNAITVGFSAAASSNNLLQVNGGTLRVQNLAGTGTFDIRSGTDRLDAGLVDVDRLVMTNTRGVFEFNGGTLSSRSSTLNNGQLFRVGNSVSPATLALTGNGTHSFANGLTISANATLTGNGAVSGILSVQTSGNLAPGASVGKIVLSNSPSLQGTVVMEISKNGATLTNDQIQVTAPLTFGGSLVVSNVGPTALAAGDRFPLFSANSFAGSFSALSLPKPGTGLSWTNKLLVDGSIEVVTWAGPKFSSVIRSGTNLIFGVTDGFPGGAFDVLTATNVATPLTNWAIRSSGTFDGSGNATVTNGIAPGEPARFFRIRVP